MGDRAQLQITDGEHSVFFYTHWAGSELAETLASGLANGGRTIHSDVSYCMGNVLKALVESCGGVTESTGFGVGFAFEDNDDERKAPLILNIAEVTVTFKDKTLSVADFLAKPASLGWA